MRASSIIRVEPIERLILAVRGHKVILDRDLAVLYGVTTGNLNKAVGRNLERFPDDFMFRLTADECRNLMFQSGRSSWGGNRKPPRAFTEEGVAMLSSVLHSARAAKVNIGIMRAFVRLRRLLRQNTEFARKLAALEQKYDAQFRVVFEAIRALMDPPARPKRRIGFLAEKHDAVETTATHGPAAPTVSPNSRTPASRRVAASNSNNAIPRPARVPPDSA